MLAARLLPDGWGFSQMTSSNGLKMSIIGGIHAVHYFRGAQRLLLFGNSVRTQKHLHVCARAHARAHTHTQTHTRARLHADTPCHAAVLMVVNVVVILVKLLSG
jgi:hypothetical protein